MFGLLFLKLLGNPVFRYNLFVDIKYFEVICFCYASTVFCPVIIVKHITGHRALMTGNYMLAIILQRPLCNETYLKLITESIEHYQSSVKSYSKEKKEKVMTNQIKKIKYDQEMP